MKAVVSVDEAKEDIGNARDWYESKTAGLGEEFRQAIQETVSRIVANPESFRKVRRNIRRAIVHRFPYGVFFIDESSRIVIIAVAHFRRSPRVWQSRRYKN